MPIVDIEKSKQLEFGSGDIEVAPGLLTADDIVGAVCFFQRETPNPIGEKSDYFKPYQVVDLKDTPVRMLFEKVESIDVVIRALEQAKKFMINKQITNEDEVE